MRLSVQRSGATSATALRLRRTYFYGSLLSLPLFTINFYLLNAGETNAVAIWWAVVGLLLPAMVLSLLLRSLVLRLFVGVFLFTQFIGVPWFVVNRERYTYSGWTAVKNFSFTFFEFIKIYTPLAVFLLFVVLFFALFSKFVRMPNIAVIEAAKRRVRSIIYPGYRKSLVNSYFVAMVVVIALLIPLNLWMFQNGISLVGITPPSLPFRLSGILHYFTKYVAPLLLFYIYLRTSRTFLPAAILSFYALVLGASQISRFTTVVMLAPVLFCAFRDQNRKLFFIALIWGLLCFQLVTLMRNVVYDVDLSSGLVARFLELFYAVQWDDFSLWYILFDICGRIESPQGIVLAHQFNPDAMGGLFVMWAHFFYQGSVPFDHEDYHLEWIEAVLPPEFVSGGGFLSYVLIMTQSQLHLIGLLAAVVASYLLFGEWIARRIAKKYRSEILYTFLSGLYMVSFIIGVGTVVFWSVVLFLLIFLFWPKVYNKTGLTHT